MNLLSNYLSPPDDPTYEDREAELLAYKASLQTRYPPVCNDCQPSLDEGLWKKEHMACTAALGSWLKRSQHVGMQQFTELQLGFAHVGYFIPTLDILGPKMVDSFKWYIRHTAVNPIFGQPSFPAPAPDIPEEDMMDWTPTNPQEKVQDRKGWMLKNTQKTKINSNTSNQSNKIQKCTN
ncbi:hypothetical protein K439DRAFT_1546227 [Ramaria rubella]|nr:hypothetical protein K439DRAFT_1546227 [Ramaria rubella]